MTAKGNLADGLLLLEDIYHELQLGDFQSGMLRLREGLTNLRNRYTTKDWAFFCSSTMAHHPIQQFLQQGPINQWAHNLPFSEITRSRQLAFAGELRRITQEHESAGLRPPQVLMLGYSHINDPAIAAANIRREREIEYTHQRFDLIFAIDHFDTLGPADAAKQIVRLLAIVKPCGRLLIANFTPELPHAAYLEAFMHYWPKYRSEEAMARLLTKVPEKLISSQCVFRDKAGSSVFLELQKAANSQ